MQTKKALYNTLGVSSLFHKEETTKEKRLFLFMAPLDNDGNIHYKAIELYTGRCRLPNVRKARTARTRAYLNNKQLFLLAIKRELEQYQKQAREQGKGLVLSLPEQFKGLAGALSGVTVKAH